MKYNSIKVKNIISAFILLLSMALLLLLNSKITVYSDDYWYGTFFDNGFEGFKEEMVDHYLNTNGRFYIHVLIPIVLLFDTKLFMFVSPVLTALLFVVFARVLNDSLPRHKLFLSGALGIFCTMAMDSQYLRMSLLWISAYFNYIFPVVVIALALYFQKRYYNGQSKPLGAVAGFVFALLSGATTEQSSIAAMVIICGYGIFSFCYSEKKSVKYFLHSFVTLLGFLTILLAPGSWQRVDRGVEGGFFSFLVPSVFAERFFDAMIYVVKYPSSVLLLAAFDLLVFFVLCFDKKFLRLSKLSLLFAALQVFSFVAGLDKLACILAAVSLLFGAVLLLSVKDYQLTGLTVLGALASHLMLIITTLNSERTAMIGIVLMIAATLSLLFRVLEKFSAKVLYVSLSAIIVVCLCAYCPLIKGYAASKTVVDENLKAIESCTESGVCELNIDIDPRYRFTMFFEGNYFYEEFRKYYNIPENIPLKFKSDIWKVSDIGTENETYMFPALEKDGVLYFPMSYAISASGGEYIFSWRDYSYLIHLNGNRAYVYQDGNVVNAQEGFKGEVLLEDFETLLPFSETYTLIYVNAEKMKEVFGIKWSFDTEQTKYIITK